MTRRAAVVLLLVTLASVVAGRPGLAFPGPRPLHTLPAGPVSLAQPPDTATCRRLLGVACYRPAQMQRAYEAGILHAGGLDGRGRTIAIIVSFGSPTIVADLRHYDRTFGLPDPPSLRIIAPAGAPPVFDGADPDREVWAEETTLDVEAAHVMAPGAGILLVVTPVPESEGLQGFPEIMRAERYVLDHNLADVISQSFGATEETFPSHDAVLGLRGAFEEARQRRVTVVAASGDTGTTDLRPDGSCCYPAPVTSWPASDPLVTSVGGTQLHLDAAGRRMAPDSVWNDRHGERSTGASGGGRSTIFPQPGFQAGVREVARGARAVPDVSMSAAEDGAMIVYWSFGSPLSSPGYHLLGGTSEAAPLFAGLVAIADQIRGGRVGWINPALYRMGAVAAPGLVGVRAGDNHFTFVDHEGHLVTVPGDRAGPGYNLATGWGTVDAALFCPLLAGQGI